MPDRMDAIDRYFVAVVIGLVGMFVSAGVLLVWGEAAAYDAWKVFLSSAYLWIFGNAIYDFIITPAIRSVRKILRP